MGGGHHAPPPEGGLDGMVRKYLPHNEHVALGILGFYGSLYLFSKLLFGGKKKAIEAPAVSSGDEIPSADSPAFGDWLGQEGSVEKLLGSL